MCRLGLDEMIFQLTEAAFLSGILVARGIQLCFELRGLITRFRLLPLKPVDLGGDAADRFFPARNFITKSGLAANAFELLLPQGSQLSFFSISPFRTIAHSEAGLSNLLFDKLLFLLYC